MEAGLRYVNNDICYPSILVTGQIMEAIESGRYDLSKTAVVITQTGRWLPRHQLHRAHPQGPARQRAPRHPGDQPLRREARREQPGL